MRRFVHFLILCLDFNLSSLTDSVAQTRDAELGQQTKSSEATKLVRKVKIEHLHGRLHTASLDLGRLESGKKYSIEVLLSNDQAQDIMLDSTRTSCRCSGFKTSGKTIASGGVLQSEISLTLPKSTKDGRFGFAVDGYDENRQHVLRLIGSAELAGNLHIDNTRSLFEIGEGISEIRIPVSISEPLQVDSLSSFGGGGLSEVLTKLTVDKGQCFLVLQLHGNLVAKSYVSGIVGVKDISTGKSAEVHMIISKSKPFVLSPSIPRFVSLRSDSESKTVSAKLFLQFLDSSLLPEGDEKLRIRCKLGEVDSVKVEVKQLSASVYQ